MRARVQVNYRLKRSTTGNGKNTVDPSYADDLKEVIYPVFWHETVRLMYMKSQLIQSDRLKPHGLTLG